MHFGVSSDVGNNGVDHAEAAPKVETVTLKDQAARLAEAHSLPKAQVNTMLGEMIEDLGKHLKKGARIRISGLGILQVRKRPARMGRNPATGEAIKIKASKKIASRIQGPQRTGDVGGDPIVDMPWAPLWRGLCFGIRLPASEKETVNGLCINLREA